MGFVDTSRPTRIEFATKHTLESTIATKVATTRSGIIWPLRTARVRFERIPRRSAALPNITTWTNQPFWDAAVAFLYRREYVATNFGFKSDLCSPSRFMVPPCRWVRESLSDSSRSLDSGSV